MCRYAWVDYYRSRRWGPSARQPAGVDLTTQIAAAHAASRGTYGAPRLLVGLRETGTHTSQTPLCPAHAGAGLAWPQKASPASPHHEQPARAAGHPQPPHRAAGATRPNQCWLTDITNLQTA